MSTHIKNLPIVTTGRALLNMDIYRCELSPLELIEGEGDDIL